MKSLKFFLVIMLMQVSVIASAETVEIDGICYNLINKGKVAEVLKKTSGKYYGDIIIPNTIIYQGDEYHVTSIREQVFKNCDGLTSIVIPSNVNSIGDDAFSGCTGLRSIIVEEGNDTFDSRDNCNALILTGDNLLIKGCMNTIIPSSVTSIKSGAFRGCNGLVSLIIPDGVKQIPDYTFDGCSSLEAIIMPNSITSIGRQAFYGCNSLSSIILPESVKSIGHSAFLGCIGLTSLTIPDSVTNLGYLAFSACTGLTTVNFGSSLSRIEERAFYNCYNLDSIIFSDAITDIGSFAFANCSSLKTLEIPNSVSGIGGGAFYGCTNLEKIVLGKNIKTIGIEAFANCNQLLQVKCLAKSVPSLSSNTFADSYIEYATLYVPESSINDYKIVETWCKFGTILPIDEAVFYKILYMVDNVLYKTVSYEENEIIVPEPSPLKEGYTFTGWSDIPPIMPNHDVTITGFFIKKDKCAEPTIEYKDGKLMVHSETSAAVCITSISSEDFATFKENEIEITATYYISTYAKAEGYENSDERIATLCWIEVDSTTALLDEKIEAMPVLIHSYNSIMNIIGVKPGIMIEVYSMDGLLIASTYSSSGVTMIQTDLRNGDVAFVRIKNKMIKVLIR